jgi:ABC-type bacteriocin/lantibiotic exporter with double-glycine peptidase domain
VNLAALWKPRYPLVRQFDSADCGPAALLTVLRTLGGNGTLAHVRKICRTTLSGSSMHDLVRAAQELGLTARGAMGEYEDLARERMPCIAYVAPESGLAHFVVVFRIKPDRVLIGDPGRGLVRMPREEFLRAWTSKVVILFEPCGSLYNVVPRSTASWFAGHLKGNAPWIVQMLFLGLLATGLGLLAASSVQTILDTLIPARDGTGLVRMGVLLGAVVLGKAGLGFFRQRFIIVLGRRVTDRLAGEFLGHLFRLPKEFFIRRQTGDITSRLGDAVKVQQAVVRVLAALFLDLFVLAGSLALLAFFSAVLFWWTLALLPLVTALFLRSARDISARNRAALQAYADVESAYIDALNGIDDILTAHCGTRFARKATGKFTRFQERVVDLGFLQARLSFLAELSSNTLSFLILCVGAGLVMDGSLGAGAMMASFSLAAFAFPSVMRLVDAGITLNGALVAIGRLMDILDAPAESTGGSGRFVMSEGLSLRGCTYGWTGAKPLFGDVSLSLQKGSFTVLWGPNGSGKSTLADILARKLSPVSGALLVDGTPAGAVSLEEYRNHVVMVPQDVRMFQGTLRENIALGGLALDVLELQRLLRDLGLSRFAVRFERNWGTAVGERGVRLSGGERQIVGLLRALVRRPDVLIVDEALSGLDIATERRIVWYLRRYARDHAVLLITHDLERMRDADAVYLLTDGTLSVPLTPEDAATRISSGLGDSCELSARIS